MARQARKPSGFDWVDFAERSSFKRSRFDYVSLQPSRQNTIDAYASKCRSAKKSPPDLAVKPVHQTLQRVTWTSAEEIVCSEWGFTMRGI
jgi:hypothetical protein